MAVLAVAGADAVVQAVHLAVVFVLVAVLGLVAVLVRVALGSN